MNYKIYAWTDLYRDISEFVCLEPYYFHAGIQVYHLWAEGGDYWWICSAVDLAPILFPNE